MEDNQLNHGVVKVFKVSEDDKTSYLYDMMEKKGGQIIYKRFDNNLSLVRTDFFDMKPDKFILSKRYIYLNDTNPIQVEIIEPEIFSFDPNDKSLTSGFKYNTDPKTTISTTGLSELSDIKEFDYKNKKIDCIKYDSEMIVKISRSKRVIETIEMKGFSLFAEGIGLIYMQLAEKGKLTNFELVRTLTINEFEELKTIANSGS